MQRDSYGPWDHPPVRAWWDSIAQIVRGATDAERLDVGRRGEDLTVSHERRPFGCCGTRPILYAAAVGFEDNTLGYERPLIRGDRDCRTAEVHRSESDRNRTLAVLSLTESVGKRQER